MPDIILKGRDTSGNLVDNVYSGVNIISVKNSAGENVNFYGTPFSYMNIYIMQIVSKGDNTQTYKAVMPFAKLGGPLGAYGYLDESDFHEYKWEGVTGNQLVLCFTMRTLTIGEEYNPADLIM